MMEGLSVISLFELQECLREGVEDLFPESVWVRAEVSSIQARNNGHCYLELSESDGSGTVSAKARAVIWRSKFGFLSAFFKEATGGDLKAGIEILVNVRVSYSEIYGLTLVIEDIDPSFTVGAAEMERRRTVERLEKENLVDRQKGLALSPIPYNLAVISAEDAAGYGDFCRHLEENEYGFRFRTELFTAAMQGENAPSSIIEALQDVQSVEGFDAVLIMRGGGSVLDLACYDDYGLCRAIATCGIPVFTAIGHERDVHVADMVAYLSVKTPTALADEFISALAAEDEQLSSLSNRIRLAFAANLAARESALQLVWQRMRQAVAGKIALQEAALDSLESRIEAVNPSNTLKRGYALVLDGNKRVVKQSAGLRSGDKLEIMFPDGTIKCIVENE